MVNQTVMSSGPLTVISLVGPQGAGKSTIAKRAATYLKTRHVEASSVVREVFGDLPRKDMPKTNVRTKTEPDWLAKGIMGKFPDTGSAVVVSGIREPIVHKFISEKHTVYGFEVRADAELRFQRQLEVRKCRSAAEFLEHELNEIKLGLFEIMFDAPYAIPTSTSTSPDKIVRAIVRVLQEAGAKLN